jgi:hypothetical protein
MRSRSSPRSPTASKLASQRVEELYALLEAHGDGAMREAIGRAVRSGALAVAGVRRALRTLGGGQEMQGRSTEQGDGLT